MVERERQNVEVSMKTREDTQRGYDLIIMNLTSHSGVYLFKSVQCAVQFILVLCGERQFIHC